MNPAPAQSADYRTGLVYAAGCYLLWGVFPLYWYPLVGSSAGADWILAQRIVWSAVFSLAVLLFMKQGRSLLRAFADRRLLTVFSCSAAAISANWLVYLWAVSRGRVLDASLGYFMAPLINILFGRLFLGEPLGRTQLFSVACAAAGIVWLAVPAGQMPWISLMLAFSFGIYSLLRKRALLDALTGMTLETLLMQPFAAAYLWYAAQHGAISFAALNALQTAVIIGSGAVTVIPLLLFAAAAKRISLSDLGMIQYLSPTMQFVLGLALFHETFDIHRFAGYAWVWLGVVVYAFGAVRRKAV
ncbi:EamA family transporter RarD [Neisseria chenwenguii]|uniref:Protein RarD n=1 Tax=Neisseria chenwenguii TaxID=1853278 RepID=A0A220S1D0_9NEIS|nr:EamA family transporter RarD [Neisseria chenwenguii]ASK27310.1 protein RarD [Neisseria chenwenguii]ROV57014.1 EamA family transporter RarD [Neisseria chenwenguii]